MPKFDKSAVKSKVNSTIKGIDFDKGFDNTVNKLWNGITQKNKGSIISVAKKNMFEFPVFISNNVPLSYATATTALLDQVYMSYLQMAISTTPVANINDVKRGLPFAALKTDTNKYIEHTDMSYAHDACNAVYQENNLVLEFNLVSIEDSDAKVINEYMDYEPLSEFSHYFQEAEDPSKKKYRLEIEKLQGEVEQHRLRGKLTKAQYEKTLKEIEQMNQNLDRGKTELEGLRVDIAKKKKDLEKLDDETQSTSKRLKSAKEASSAGKVGPQLDEAAMQRLNTMKPIVQAVTVRTVDDNNNIVAVNQDYIIGVKTHSRLIDSSILPEVAEYPLKEMNKISRKAKWRAGELKFFKDILFNIKQKKQTAMDSRDPKRKWYRRLYTLAHSKGDSISATYFSKHAQNSGVIPNVSMIITKGDVENIKNQTKIDLLDSKTAVNFCNELFLMCFVVIDNDAESIRMLIPDLHNDFEIHSIASVNKQLSMLDTSGSKTREVFKMLK